MNDKASSESRKDPNQMDDRAPGDWKSIYCDCAWKHIKFESYYVASILVLCVLALALNWIILHILLDNVVTYRIASNYIFAFFSGMIGGSLFTMKWLYHSVARKKWHLDRSLWRYFTPWISGFFALTMYVMMTSGLLSAFNADAIRNGTSAFSIGFLVGYFSDSAMSKFKEIADTLFGTNQDKQK
ncbi:hypothetical protein [Rheinheimera sp.]|uniref:hypothetical protein n=1 Tax=Rheinheimera sp. TaxID=1869214 RepID=UPI00307E8FEC